ncbi:PRR5L [Bugula neritina]|uniref:PRR5L n=1 Tax=Bugula neritina TaxID=10212 RepID=A0A7J7KE59_BUGNE|nr:PRR5L [Bugula neritina]
MYLPVFTSSTQLLDAGIRIIGGMLANRRGSSAGDLGVSTGNLGDVTGAEDVFSYVQEPEETAKYKSNLPKLYGNELLSVVQKGIIALFQGKSPEDSLISLNSKVKSLIKLDIGEFVVPFYEERILKKGMWIIREDIKEDEGENLLVGLTDIWNNFYRELLPALQVIFSNLALGFCKI